MLGLGNLSPLYLVLYIVTNFIHGGEKFRSTVWKHSMFGFEHLAVAAVYSYYANIFVFTDRESNQFLEMNNDDYLKFAQHE